MIHKSLIDGALHEITGGRGLIAGAVSDVNMGRTLIDGAGYDILFGIPIGDLPVGDSVYMHIGGVLTEFFIVHQGIPTEGINGLTYGSSCEGTWVLQKNIHCMFEERMPKPVSYTKSFMREYIEGEYFNLIDPDVADEIKEVTLPDLNSWDSMGNDATPQPFKAKVFLLHEYDPVTNRVQTATLDYFKDEDAPWRTADYNGAATPWFTRTPNNDDLFCFIHGNANGAARYSGIRPAMVFPFETRVSIKSHRIMA